MLYIVFVASHTKGKKQLLEEIVQVKKTKELTDRQISQKEMGILHSKQELEDELLKLAGINHKIQLLQAQVHITGIVSIVNMSS